jgi:hypothetical protein
MERLIPDSISYEDGIQVPLIQIRHRYANSEYGRILNNQLRWEPSIRNGTTPDQWRKAFGADVNNLLHMDLSCGLVKTVARRFKSVELNSEDLEILLLTAQTHDWAEAVIGDKSFVYKNESDEEEEIGILRALLEEFLPEDLKSASPKIPQVISTLTDKETLRYKIFNVVEQIGYLRTSKRAYLIKDNFPEEQKDALHAMACQPFITNVPKIIHHSRQFPELSEFVLHPKVLQVWKDILADCDFIDYEKYYPTKGKSLCELLPAIKKGWVDFLERHGKE